MIALPLTPTSDVSVTIQYDAGADEVIVIPFSTTTYYNLLDGSSEDLLTHVADTIDAASAHTWTASDPVAGTMTPGRSRLTCVAVGDEVDQVLFPTLLQELLGYKATTASVVTGTGTTTAIMDSVNTRAACWIPGTHGETVVVEAWTHKEDIATLTEGASGPLTNDIYGSKEHYPLMVHRIRAAFVFDHFAALASFVAFDPDLNFADPNLTFEALCHRWARTSGIVGRIYPDHTDKADYKTVRAGRWVNHPRTVFTRVGSRARLRFNLALQATVR